MRFAIIQAGLVENIIVAPSVPVIPGRTVIALAPGQAVSPGDSYDGAAFTAYQPTAAEIERRDAPFKVRQAAATLTAWADEAQAVADQGTNVTQAQLKALYGRQAIFWRRFRDLLLAMGMDS